MRRIGKITMFTGIGLLSLILIAVLAISAFVIKRPVTTTSELAEVKPYKWNKVKLDGNVISSDGSEYFLWNKKGKTITGLSSFPEAGPVGMPKAPSIRSRS